jgi:serine protease Do
VRHLALQTETGVAVLSFEANSPAQISGIQERDILVELDGQPLRDIDDLHRLLNSERIGTLISLKLIRQNNLYNLTVIPTEIIP